MSAAKLEILDESLSQFFGMQGPNPNRPNHSVSTTCSSQSTTCSSQNTSCNS